MKTYISSKIHGIRVTDKSVNYNGSVSISKVLCDAAEIDQYEQVDIVNLENGNRWTTYVLYLDKPESFTLNGGGAYLGDVGDRCVVMTYAITDQYSPATVIFCDQDNQIKEKFLYENP